MAEVKNGEMRMIDVGNKEETDRVAVASGHIRMKAGTLRVVMEGNAPKGDIIGAARFAGIMAAKRTCELIPLCHQVRLASIEMSLLPDEQLPGIKARAVVKARDRTGVEMEALTAVSAGLLTVYDMLKGIDKEMEISYVRLDRKEGGRSGRYIRRD